MTVPQKAAPSLDYTLNGLQLVDGNNFLLARFRQPTDGFGVRSIAADINRCVFPPIFVFDGFNNNKRRRDLYPGYKVRTEKEMAVKENLMPSIELMRELMKFCSCITVQCPTWEADDVIATLASQASAASQPVRVVTTDKDLSQLAALPHVVCTSEMKGVNVEHVRLYKTLVGDPSDKIKGVPGFGDGAFLNCHKDELVAIFQSGTWPAPTVGHNNYGMRFTHYEWLQNNWDQALILWDITGLKDVPMAEISAGTRVGVRNPAVMNKLLAEYLL